MFATPSVLHCCYNLVVLCNLQVVESVNELAQIMKDLSALVIDQV